MDIIVQKYGGTSVADVNKLERVSKNIIREKQNGKGVVVVVSAQGKTTNKLIAGEEEITKHPSKREHDVLVSVGEQITIAKLSMMLNEMGHKAKSYLAWQIPIVTNDNFNNARIKYINGDKLKKDLEEGYILIVAGFQGITEQGEITTLGRGGSDTTAVALAATLKARCDIYTDVDGVLTADPRAIENARKINNISYDEMLEFASMGAKVLHNRCVEIAKENNTELYVRTIFEDGTPSKGTEISDTKNLETFSINGVTKDDNVSRIIVTDVKNEIGSTYKLFKVLADESVDVDLVTQSMGENALRTIAFTVKRNELERVINILENNKKGIYKGKILHDENLSKITIIGIGIENKPDVAAKMFEALSERKINIQMINTSEIKISVLVLSDRADEALEVVYDKFFD